MPPKYLPSTGHVKKSIVDTYTLWYARDLTMLTPYNSPPRIRPSELRKLNLDVLFRFFSYLLASCGLLTWIGSHRVDVIAW
jgi:hypothetical protein